jgi:catechol 2,3-dioxygenase-like lactoylglutathione lyase family enzyme
MTIKRLDHVSVVVNDLAAAIAFFTALGIETGYFAQHNTCYADEPHDNNRPAGERLSRCEAPKAIATCD